MFSIISLCVCVPLLLSIFFLLMKKILLGSIMKMVHNDKTRSPSASKPCFASGPVQPKNKCLFLSPISFSEFYTTTFFKLKTPFTSSPGTVSVELSGFTGQSCEHACERGSTNQNCGKENSSILNISKFWHSQG